ncbi:MAG: hypothetical protein ABDH49_03345 [Candidatus Hydrothermales bacterium]
MGEIKRMPLLGDSFPKIKVATTVGFIELPNYFKGKKCYNW